ncbi:class II aldolase/adducin family protein [Propionibacterium australiense]|uniref:Class II Aldolase and Adducin N-terminal domain n=1 Tax=Propionibacterium australiense TaxID=119981 RepID=A0A383S9S7_9ACTN|nr:class II aldolase/adducin family protein [Propionibacterium australiense]RLP06669.1 class II aldolase/adducin family protein [Propionibacterium australiense]RLP06692.1 class II aldolase/adducin family protein [Propionibacterium australiense]SYZ34292.1 Class II Aldolase and Adducin N-terminal domain [Propionibacterium australiense]VEH92171.1 L-fuculose phosphate aldolase [Propionibacterium australiense]
MILEEERSAVVRTCQEMQRLGLVVGTAGNVSVRVGDRVVISPSAVEYQDLVPEMVGVHDMDGAVVDAELKPSSELPLHLAVYKGTAAAAITHNHAPASTALGLVVDVVPCSHYYSGMFGGPIRVAPYAHFGTGELADNVCAALQGRLGALMSNHGAITIGPSLEKAFSLLPYLEYVCEIQLRAMGTGLPVKTLDEDQMAYVLDGLKTYVPARIER